MLTLEMSEEEAEAHAQLEPEEMHAEAERWISALERHHEATKKEPFNWEGERMRHIVHQLHLIAKNFMVGAGSDKSEEWSVRSWEIAKRGMMAAKIFSEFKEDWRAVEWLVPRYVCQAAMVFSVVTPHIRERAIGVKQGGVVWKLIRSGVLNASNEEKRILATAAGMEVYVPPGRELHDDMLLWRQLLVEKIHDTFHGNMFTRHGNANEGKCHALCVEQLRTFFEDRGVEVMVLPEEGSRFDPHGTANASRDAAFVLLDHANKRLEMILGEYKCPQAGYGRGNVKMAHIAQMHKQMAIYLPEMEERMDKMCEELGYRRGAVMQYHSKGSKGEGGYPEWERACVVYATLPKGKMELETLTAVYAREDMPLDVMLKESTTVWMRCFIPFRAMHLAGWLHLAELFPREYMDVLREHYATAARAAGGDVVMDAKYYEADSSDSEYDPDAGLEAFVNHAGSEMDPLHAVRKKGGWNVTADTGTELGTQLDLAEFLGEDGYGGDEEGGGGEDGGAWTRMETMTCLLD